MIKDLAELQKLLKLCRKQGVTEIKLGDIAIKFGDGVRDMSEQLEASDEIPAPELTPDQLIYYSVNGEPMP